LEQLGQIGAAARAVGVDPKTVWDARQADPEFGAAVEKLCEVSVVEVEDTLFKMATSGDHVAATIFFLKCGLASVITKSRVGRRCASSKMTSRPASMPTSLASSA
jgi:hypothetical protein